MTPVMTQKNTRQRNASVTIQGGDFSNKQITDKDLKNILKVIQQNESLKKSNLSFNNITSKGFKKILITLKDHP